MGRWLAAVLVLLGALAAGLVAFLNGGAPVAIALTPQRTVMLPLGVGLALAFAAGAALVALLALGGAVARAWRRGAAARARARTAKGVARARVHAETLLVGGDAEAARSRLTTAVTAHGPDEHLLALMAGAAERAGDVPGAIAAVEAARTRLPASPLLARRLSDLYAAAGRWDDALSVEHELVDSLSPAAAAAETDTVCGLRYEAAMADPDRAQGLRRLLALGREHPAFVPAWVAAGDRLRESGRPFRARRAYEHGARARPATVLLERLAALDVEAKRPERTERRLARLRARHPHDAALLATLVRRQLERGALDDAEAALATGPDVPALAALRATCAARRGRADEAVALFERAVAELDGPGGARCTACRSRVDAWSARCPACGRWDVIETSGALMPSPSGNPAVDRCVGEGPG